MLCIFEASPKVRFFAFCLLPCVGKLLPKVQAKVEAQRQARQGHDTAPHQGEGYCPIHDVQMQRGKEGDGWYHKAGERESGKAIWCRGK